MSRSRRKTPITGTCVCRSERHDKLMWHSRFRARVREAIIRDDEVMPHVREVSDVWSFGKDGKTYWGNREWFRNPHQLWGK